MRNIIKYILKEEVNKKYPKPTPNVEKLIYNWLNNYFDGSQMYQNKDHEFSYTFEWCNNGMEIAQARHLKQKKYYSFLEIDLAYSCFSSTPDFRHLGRIVF